MKPIICSCHAERRMNQRGIREKDVDLIRRCGTHLEDDDESFLLTNKDVVREIGKRKREIQALERLRGSQVVMTGGVIKTAYHTTVKRRKRALKRLR